MPIQVPVVQTGLEQSIQQAAAKAGKNLRINMGPGAKSIESLSKPLGRLTGKADEFTKSMEAANARVLAFGASVGVIAAVSKGLQELVKTTIEVEKSLTNINSILKQSESQLDSFKNQIFDIARNTGQTFDTVAEAALELSRQGLKAEEVTKRLNDALVLSRLSGLSAADSVAGLTAAVNSFSSAGLTTTEVLNKISAAAASAAVSDRDLIEGLKRSGAVAVASGVQFDELIGIISALQERTARGGAVIGNSLKTIFTRIQDIEKLQSLQKLGVQVTDLEGKVLSSNKIIENLAPTFAKLDQASKVNLADNLVGKFQIAPFLALLEDYNLKVSRSGEVAATSFNATNEAYQRNEALSKTLASAVNAATVNLKELANALGEIGVTDSLKNIIGVFNSIVSSITDVLDGDGIGSQFAQGLIKGISAIISGPGLALALVAIGKLLLDFAKFGAGALKTFFGLNKAAEAQKNFQGQIAASLLNDKGIRSAILSIEKQNISEGEKKKLQTQFFTKALNEQLMVMQKMQGIARTIAPGVMAGTASRRGKRAAGGFLPIGAESSDISRGVGGAPASAKPVVIPNFAFGGGKRGTMVANDSEYIVPNYANGGDAIFNQNMASSIGLPANARKVRAAGGYIPNYADLNKREKSLFNKFLATKGLKASDLAGPGGRVGTTQRAYDNSKYGRQFDELDPTQRRNLIVRARQKTVTSKGVDASSPYGILYPDALGNQNAQTIAIGNSRVKTIPIATEPSDLLYKKVRKSLVSAASKYAKGLGFKPDIVKEQEFKKSVDRNLNEGSVESAFGTVFEAAFQGAIGTEKGRSNSRWDLATPAAIQSLLSKISSKGLLSKVVGPELRTVQKADFKNTLSSDNLSSIASKIKSSPVGKASTGYIPNFVDPLQDAIGREQAAGLPVSQIRINQSGKLRNAQNPMGLAVTNTRDEPTGAIPNYAEGGTGEVSLSLKDVGSSAKGLKSELDNLNNLINSLNAEIAAGKTTHAEASSQIDQFSQKVSKNAKSQEKIQSAAKQQLKTEEEVTKANKNYLGIIFGVQAGLTALSAATADSNNSLGQWTNIVADTGSTLTGFLTAGEGLKELSEGMTDAEGELTKLGKSFSFVGKALGKVGAAVTAFQLLDSITVQLTGSNDALINSSDKLADAFDKASIKVEDFDPEKRSEFRGSAARIVDMANTVYAGEFDNFAMGGRTDAEQLIQESMAKAMSLGISEQRLESLFDKIVTPGDTTFI